MYYVYCIQNKVNNKVYVGWSSNYKNRWKTETKRAFLNNGGRDYNSLLSRAFRKYAKEQNKVKDFFNFYVLEEFENKEESLEAEQFWIEYFRSNIHKYSDKYGYNQHEGGSCGILGYKFTKEQRKKLGSKGEKNPSAKLTQEQVIQIREEYKLGQTSCNKLGLKFGVSKNTISRILLGKNWKQDDLNYEDINEIKNKRYIRMKENGWPSAKLNYELADEIRNYYKKNEITYIDLGKKYNLSANTIKRVIKGAWTKLKEDNE